MKEIQLTKGYKAQVDNEDYKRVNQYLWQADVDLWPIARACGMPL